MKTKWLNRRIARPGPYLALCLSDAEYREAMRRLKPPDLPKWLKNGSAATTHTFTNEDGNTCCVVCLGNREGRNAIEIAGLLVHEAVHVWQNYCDDIGETDPGSEQEAYAIQCVAQELLAEYARRIE